LIREQNRVIAKKRMLHDPPPEVADAIKEASKIEAESGWPSSIRDRAYAVKKPNEQYDIVFTMLSSIVHSAASSTTRKIQEAQPGQWRVAWGPSGEWVDTALITVFVSLKSIADVSYDAFGLDKRPLDKIEGNFEAFNREQMLSSGN
jgi:hypothetical protein